MSMGWSGGGAAGARSRWMAPGICIILHPSVPPCPGPMPEPTPAGTPPPIRQYAIRLEYSFILPGCPNIQPHHRICVLKYDILFAITHNEITPPPANNSIRPPPFPPTCSFMIHPTGTTSPNGRPLQLTHRYLLKSHHPCPRHKESQNSDGLCTRTSGRPLLRNEDPSDPRSLAPAPSGIPSWRSSSDDLFCTRIYCLVHAGFMCQVLSQTSHLATFGWFSTS